MEHYAVRWHLANSAESLVDAETPQQAIKKTNAGEDHDFQEADTFGLPLNLPLPWEIVGVDEINDEGEVLVSFDAEGNCEN